MAPPRGRNGNISFPRMVGPGENPNGFRAITPNGVASDTGEGFNQETFRYNQQVDGERWNGPENNFVPVMGAPRNGRRGGPTPRGRGNRTGE